MSSTLLVPTLTEEVLPIWDCNPLSSFCLMMLLTSPLLTATITSLSVASLILERHNNFFDVASWIMGQPFFRHTKHRSASRPYVVQSPFLVQNYMIYCVCKSIIEY